MEHHDELKQTILRNINTVYRLAYAQMKNTSDADDVYQEVFYRYIRKKPFFENQEHKKAWFIRVTVNCCKTSLKSFWKTKVCELDKLLKILRLRKKICHSLLKNFLKNILPCFICSTSKI